MAQDEEVEIIPPTVDRVKRRLMVLWANSGRSYLEDEYRSTPDDGRSFSNPLQAWVLTKLNDEATEREIQAHAKPLGNWSDKEIIDFSWDKQAGSILEWALGLDVEFPGWNLSSDCSDAVDDFFEFPDPSTWRPDLTLKTQEEVDSMGVLYETCYWRLRSEEQSEYGLKLMGRASRLGTISLASDGDLAMADGRSVATATADELSLATSLAMMRLTACNWLSGFDEIWDDVTADTIVPWLWDENWVEPS